MEEDVLGEVVNVRVRHAGEQNAVDHASIAGVEQAKGGAVTALGGANERVVGAAGIQRQVHGRETGAGRVEFKECRHVGSIESKNRLLR